MIRFHITNPQSPRGSLQLRLLAVVLATVVAATTTWWGPQVVTITKAAEVGPDVNVTADQFTVLGEWTYFRQFTELYGDELWRTNGTKTELVQDIDPRNPPVSSGDRPESLTAWKGWIWFIHGDNVHGNELWRTNGVTTELYLDRVPTDSSDTWGPNVHAIFRSDNHLYFFTPSGVERMNITGKRDIVFSAPSCALIPAVVDEWNPKNDLFISAEGSLFAICVGLDGGSETIFEFYEATASLTVNKVTDIEANCDCNIGEPRRQIDGSWIAFKYPLDGEPALPGLQLVYISQNLDTVDYNYVTLPGVDGGPRGIWEADYETLPNGILYSWGWDADHGVELWKVDSGNMSRISDLVPGVGSAWPSEISRYNNTLIFTAGPYTDPYYPKLYYLDEDAPVEISAPDGVTMNHPRKLTVIGDTLFFVADDEASMARVYEIDLSSVTSSSFRFATSSALSTAGFVRTAISGTPGLATQLPAGAEYVGDETPSPLRTSSVAAYVPFSIDEEESVAALRVESLVGQPVYASGMALLGSARPGAIITIDPGLWTAVPAPTFRYQWYACSSRQKMSELPRMPTGCRAIRGATAATYSPGRRDLNKYVRVLVHAANGVGSQTYVSPPVRIGRR